MERSALVRPATLRPRLSVGFALFEVTPSYRPGVIHAMHYVTHGMLGRPARVSSIANREIRANALVPRDFEQARNDIDILNRHAV